METIVYDTNPLLDKTGWPTGEWDNEPDKMQWQDETTGLPCLVVRNRWGALCGYVGVPNNHRFYEIDYHNVVAENGDHPRVHGGLTFASKCSEGPENETICHVPEAGESDDVWWLGFDCGHFMDTMPGMMRLDLELGVSSLNHGTYKPLRYVQSECVNLAAWLKDNQ